MKGSYRRALALAHRDATTRFRAVPTLGPMQMIEEYLARGALNSSGVIDVEHFMEQEDSSVNTAYYSNILALPNDEFLFVTRHADFIQKASLKKKLLPDAKHWVYGGRHTYPPVLGTDGDLMHVAKTSAEAGKTHVMEIVKLRPDCDSPVIAHSFPIPSPLQSVWINSHGRYVAVGLGGVHIYGSLGNLLYQRLYGGMFPLECACLLPNDNIALHHDLQLQIFDPICQLAVRSFETENNRREETLSIFCDAASNIVVVTADVVANAGDKNIFLYRADGTLLKSAYVPNLHTGVVSSSGHILFNMFSTRSSFPSGIKLF